MTEAFRLTNTQHALLDDLVSAVCEREQRTTTPITQPTGFYSGDRHARSQFWLGLEIGIPLEMLLEAELNLLDLKRRKLLLNHEIRVGDFLVPITNYEKLEELKTRLLAPRPVATVRRRKF